MINKTEITDEFVEYMVQLAIQRIQRAYDLAGGQIYLSFSGGKDSTIVAELIKMANLSQKIPFVFANTGIELRATLDFVQNYDYENVHIVKPRKPFGQVLKEYGVPAISKLKSEHLKTYQRNINNPMDFTRCRHLITGEMEKGGQKLGKPTQVALKYEDFHFLHPDLEYKISNKCCQYMKKYPMEDFTKELDRLKVVQGHCNIQGQNAQCSSSMQTMKNLFNVVQS